MSRAQGRLRSIGGASVSLVDQIVSGGTNFIAVIAVASSLTAHQFGAFAVAYICLTLFLGLSRAYFGIPIALTTRTGTAVSDTYHAAITAVLLLTIPMAVLTLVVGSIFVGAVTLDPFFAVIALVTPFVLLQDVSRYEATAKGSPHLALISDVLWLAGIVTIWLLRDVLSTQQILGAWVGVAVSASLMMLVALKPKFRLRAALVLLRPRRGARDSVSINLLITAGVSLLVTMVIQPIFGAASVGALRAAGTLMGPVNTLITFIDFRILAKFAALPQERRGRYMTSIVAFVSFAVVAWGVVLLLLPGDVGRALLGETWALTREILPITVFEYFAIAVMAALSISIKFANDGRTLLFAKLLSVGAVLVSLGIIAIAQAPFVWVPVSLVVAAFIALGYVLIVVVRRSASSRLPATGNVKCQGDAAPD